MYLSELKRYINSERAEFSKRYLKSDRVFLGSAVPDVRRVALKFWQQVSFTELSGMLESPVHEERLLACFILVLKFEKTKSAKERGEIVKFYLANLKGVDNWDLVDSTAYKILGAFAVAEPLYFREVQRLALSRGVWERRTAMVAMKAFIGAQGYKEVLEVASMLLAAREDMVQKAVGWMLRELGISQKDLLVSFLRENKGRVGSITFSYATEKMSKEEKRALK